MRPLLGGPRVCLGGPSASLTLRPRHHATAAAPAAAAVRSSSSNNTKHSSSSSSSSSSSNASSNSSSSSSESSFSLLLQQEARVFVRRSPRRALGLPKVRALETPRKPSSNSSNSSSSNSSSSSRRKQQQSGVSHVSELLCRLAKRQLREGNVSACVTSLEAAAVRQTLNPKP